MRTADRLISRDWAFPLGLKENSGFMEDVAKEVNNSPVVVADNVAQYVDSHSQGALEDYPSLAPPWPKFWIEYPSSSGHQRRGVWVVDTTEYADLEVELYDELPDDGRHVPMLAAGAKKHALAANGADPDAVRWVVTFALFIEQDRSVWGPSGLMSLALDEGGKVLGNRWSLAPVLSIRDRMDEWRDEHWQDALDADQPIPSLDDLEEMRKAGTLPDVTTLHKWYGSLIAAAEQNEERATVLERRIREYNALSPMLEGLAAKGEDWEDHMWLLRALAPALQTVAFLHCKNVVVEKVVPSAKVQAKRSRRGREPLVRYHTLRLEVPRRQGSGGGSGASGDAAALHIVAGHFAHYGACCTDHEPHGMLFGRLSGVYWVGTHIRGDRGSGEVRTDFEVAHIDGYPATD